MRGASSTVAEAAICRLLLCRHGETTFNVAGRCNGPLESELTDVGLGQADELGMWLAAAELPADRVFVSPLLRTRQTLAAIEAHAPRLPEATVRPGLREIEMTQWDGQLFADLRSSDAERYAEWQARPSSFIFAEDGHSPLGDLQCRAAEEWEHVVSQTPAGSTSLVVAHGAYNRAFTLTALGLPVDDVGFRDDHFAFANCGTVELRWPAGAVQAAEWRKRWPQEGAWTSREEEVWRMEALRLDAGPGGL